MNLSSNEFEALKDAWEKIETVLDQMIESISPILASQNLELLNIGFRGSNEAINIWASSRKRYSKKETEDEDYHKKVKAALDEYREGLLPIWESVSQAFSGKVLMVLILPRGRNRGLECHLDLSVYHRPYVSYIPSVVVVQGKFPSDYNKFRTQLGIDLGLTIEKTIRLLRMYVPIAQSHTTEKERYALIQSKCRGNYDKLLHDLKTQLERE